MMTVREVSRRTGVTVRALQYYDQIGLLPPAKRTEAGYRLYDERALQRLGQILLFRELEFSLDEIRAILDRPDFDRDLALSDQIKLLTMRRDRLDALIDLANTLKQEGGTSMDFTAFDKTGIDQYAEQARARWGKTPEYAEYDGRTKLLFGKKMAFFSDAYRVAMNIGLDAAWNGPTEVLSRVVERLQKTVDGHPELLRTACQLDGSLEGTPVMHPLGLLAATAAGSLALEGEASRSWAQRLWDAEPRKGVRRYYDNCLYFFSLLMMAGRYRNWLED